MKRHYRYVGPPEIADRVTGEGGILINSAESLGDRLRSMGASIQTGESFTVTFVIDLDGKLRIADRRSEHVMCAGGKPVLSAGEMTFTSDEGCIFVERVTNQSTGYCPESESWSAVAEALDRLQVRRPECFDPAFIFRRCPSCLQINIVKDDWYECEVCQTALPRQWNFD